MLFVTLLTLTVLLLYQVFSFVYSNKVSFVQEVFVLDHTGIPLFPTYPSKTFNSRIVVFGTDQISSILAIM